MRLLECPFDCAYRDAIECVKNNRNHLGYLTRMRRNEGVGSITLMAVALLMAAASGSRAPAASPADSRTVATLRDRLAHPRPNDTIVIAHRACWKGTSENSLAAVRACIAMHVDGVEFDVRHTKDGVAVIMHDETVDRTTDGHGLVSEMTSGRDQVFASSPRPGRPSSCADCRDGSTLARVSGSCEGTLAPGIRCQGRHAGAILRCGKVPARRPTSHLLLRMPQRSSAQTYPLVLGRVYSCSPSASTVMARCRNPSARANRIRRT